MPKINRFQIINFRYSKGGLRLLTDKIMFLDGDNTQFEATNSVGKSMQIQTLLQSVCPLVDVSKKAIDIYKIKQPVYSLVEWVLNDGETLLLTGIGFERKSSSIGEESHSNKKNELFKYFTFTVEYNNNSNLTLDNLGIIEYDKDGNKKINSLSFVENKLRTLSKGSNGKINVFAQSSNNRYSEKLYECGISQKEFKDIIVKLNSGEYTLNAFISQYNTTEKLLRQRILPLIEDSLVGNNDVPRIKEQTDNVLEFMETVISNKDAVDSYNELTLLLKMMEDSEEWLDKSIKSEKEKIEAINKLSDLYYHCEQKHMECRDLIDTEKNLLTEYMSKKEDIKYKERSYKYRLDEDEILKIDSSLKTIESKIADARLILEDYMTDLNTLKLNEIEKDIKECIADKSKIEAEKEVLTIEHQELVDKLKEIGSNIKYHLVRSINVLTSNIGDSIGAIKELTEVISNETEKINGFNNELSFLKAQINTFENQKNKFNSRFDALCSKDNSLESYIVRQIDRVDVEFDRLIGDLDKKIISYDSNIDCMEKEIDNLNVRIKETRDEKSKIYNNIGVLNLEKQQLEERVNEYNRYSDNLNILINDYELDENKLWDKDLKIECIDSFVNSLNKSKESMVISRHNIKEELIRLEKGGLIQISEELLDEIKGHGISPIMGFEYLIQNEDKSNLLKLNPLMPYSLIVTKSEYNKLIKINFKTFSESLIPIIVRENINIDNSVKIFDMSEGLIYSKDSSFLKSIDLSILDPVLRNEKILDLKNKINKIDETIKDLSSTINRVVKIRADIVRVSFCKDDYKNMMASMEDIDSEIDSNKESLVLKDSFINNCNSKILELSDKSKELRSKLFENKKIQSQLEALAEDFIEVEKNNELIIDYKNKITILNKRIELAKDEIRGFSGILDLEKDKRYNLQKELEEKNAVLKKYDIYSESNSLDIDLDEAIIRYETLSNNSTGTTISELDKRLSVLEDRYKKLKMSKEDLLEEIKDLVHKDAVTIYLSKKELRDNIEKSEYEIKELGEKRNKLDKEKSQKEGSLINQSQTIVDDFGKAPCKKEDIDSVNFKESLREIKQNIGESEKRLKTYDKNFVKIETMLKNLEKHKQDRRAFKIDTSLDIEDLKNMLDVEISNKSKELAYNVNKYNVSLSNADDFNVRLNFKYDNILRVIKVNKENYCKQKESMINVKTFITEQIKIYAYNKEFVAKLKNTITMDLVNYCKDVVEQLRVFNRLGTMNGEKFFEIKLPNEENIKYYEILEEVLTDIMESGDEKDIISKIDTYYMLNRLISISSLKINVMLFELKGRRDKIEWNKVLASTSGGQRFCISFVVLTLLLEYRRYDNKKTSNTSASKVLIMDNPFGETSEEEFLIHVFNLAEKFDVQIISYTHITNYSVRERFKRIYKMIVEQTVDGREVVLIENEKVQEDEYVNQFKYHISKEQQQFMGFEEI